MGVNFGRDTLEFALINKKHLYEVRASELQAHYQMAMNRLICYAAVDSKEKAKLVSEGFQHINKVFDTYIEAVSIGSKRRKDLEKESTEQDKGQPIISVKNFFEKQVLGKMDDDKVPFTTQDILSALQSIKS